MYVRPVILRPGASGQSDYVECNQCLLVGGTVALVLMADEVLGEL